MTNKEKIKLHTEVSYWKSGLRMVGCTCLAFDSHAGVSFAALFLFTAEILGIVEEAIL